MANLRADRLHKLTTRLSQTHHVIGGETLAIKNMMAAGGSRKRGFNRALGDAGVGELFRELCAVCGQLRRVSCRDRDGAPRCTQCPLDDGRDPNPQVVDVVARADPTLPTDMIAAATAAAAPQAGQRHRLAWALQDRPDLLTGNGAQAPVPRCCG